MITYTARLKFQSLEDEQKVVDILRMERESSNLVSKFVFDYIAQHGKRPSRKIIYDANYSKLRQEVTGLPAQIAIRAMRSVYSMYKSIKSNEHKLVQPAKKNKYSLRFDKRLYRIKSDSIFITVSGNPRVEAKIQSYDKLNELLTYDAPRDPEIFIKNSEVWIALSFLTPAPEPKNDQAIGIDLGVKRLAAISDGRIIKNTFWNGCRRKTRFQKRQLQQVATKSAKRKLRKARRKERNQSKNTVHHIANEILKTEADNIVLEDLTKIKSSKKKKSRKFSNRISQVPFYLIKQTLTYKAERIGKRIVLVNPAYTSQNDFRGIEKGERKGCRYYASDGVVLDADLNAANNIVKRSKLPDSCQSAHIVCDALDGQAVVNQPNCDEAKPSCKCTVNRHKSAPPRVAGVLQAAML